MLTLISLLLALYFVVFILSLCGWGSSRMMIVGPYPRIDFHICHGCSNFTLLWFCVEVMWLRPPSDPGEDNRIYTDF